MTREEIEACWRDPGNYKWGVVYYCKADPRAIVPRRLKWTGWTVNFARPSAIPVMLLLLAILVAPVSIVNAKEAGSGVVLVAVAASITILFLVCAFLSSRMK